MGKRRGASVVVLGVAQAAYSIFAVVYVATKGWPVFGEGRTNPYLSYVALNVFTMPLATLALPLVFTLAMSRQPITARTAKLLKAVWLNSLVMIPAAALVYKGLTEGWIGHFSARVDRPVWFLVLEGAAFLMLADFSFYVTHRALHSRLLYRFHKAHHQHRTPTEAATFMALSPAEAHLSGILMITFPMFLIPVHAHVLIVCLGIIVFSGFYVHDGALVRALRVPFINGPAEHQMHHARGRENANYALIFTFLDRLFGTAAAPPREARAERQIAPTE